MVIIHFREGELEPCGIFASFRVIMVMFDGVVVLFAVSEIFCESSLSRFFCKPHFDNKTKTYKASSLYFDKEQLTFFIEAFVFYNESLSVN
jgi:hypothetical protein